MIERRSFLRSLAGALLGAPVIVDKGSDEPIKGVGILRYPSGTLETEKQIRDIARTIAADIKQGTILCMSNEKDHHGTFVWDFTIEGGDPSQVKIERKE